MAATGSPLYRQGGPRGPRYVFRRIVDLRSRIPPPTKKIAEIARANSGTPPVLGRGLSDIVSGTTSPFEFTSPEFVLTSSILPLSAVLLALAPSTTWHP